MKMRFFLFITFVSQTAVAFRLLGNQRAAVRWTTTMSAAAPKTMLDKIWESHVVDSSEGNTLIYVDRHLVHEVTSPQAFEGLRTAGRRVRRPDCTLVTVDHNVPTSDRSSFKAVESFIKESDSRTQVMALEENVKEFDLVSGARRVSPAPPLPSLPFPSPAPPLASPRLPFLPLMLFSSVFFQTYYAMDDARQGIVHIIGPEQGFTVPGTVIVCGDSHTATHGAFGSLAFGIGTSEVEHVLATQTLVQSKAKSMRVTVEGKLQPGVTSKDVVLAIIGVIGTAGGNGHVIEFAGSAIASLSMEARMSVCNMAIEGGARAGMIAPDAITFEYLKGRPMAPKGKVWDQAVAYWKTLVSDPGAVYDKEVTLKAEDIAPTVTWGTSPQDVAPITGTVPNPDAAADPARGSSMARSLQYMGLQPGTPLDGLKVDKVFVGSCTNARIEDIRAVAAVAKGRKVASTVYAMVVPGSGLVKAQAEAEGLDTILKEAGFDWREPGCSMCLAMNPDKLEPGERCASTSNRNFEGRQGVGGRTHLVSPAMAAAAAVTGTLTDVRKLSLSELPPPKPSVFAELIAAMEKTRPAPIKSTTSAATAASAGSTSASSAAACDPTKQFVRLEGIAAKLDIQNIDTDMIIPGRFLKTIKRSGLGVHAFSALRYNEDGTEKPDFVLNKPAYRQASILVAADNFGCGSSREHAPWALRDLGVRCVISTSFADIFYNNCFKNGMLPIVVTRPQLDALMADADARKTLDVDPPRMARIAAAVEHW